MSTHPLRLRPFALVAIAALALAVAPAAAGAGAAQRARPPLPTVVLVHGAFADSSSWNPVISKLERQGYPVIAPANPLRGLTSDSAYLSSVLGTIDGPIVLVGHSYGGAVITDAATGNPNVKALVYIAAFAPDTGDSLASISQAYPNSDLGASVQQRPYPGGVDLYINPTVFRQVFAADLPAGATAKMAVTQRPLGVAGFTDPSTTPAWKTIPSWYLVASNDHAIDPAAERFMASRAGAHTTEIRSSHVAMLSHPDTVVRLITDAAHATA
jgi:pimeloyl-ACP methyl ester carboxylesterase